MSRHVTKHTHTTDMICTNQNQAEEEEEVEVEEGR
jgi:hypothetical protein